MDQGADATLSSFYMSKVQVGFYVFPPSPIPFSANSAVFRLRVAEFCARQRRSSQGTT